jgi:hypothetical protein
MDHRINALPSSVTSYEKQNPKFAKFTWFTLSPRHYWFLGFVSVCLLSCSPLYLIIANGVNVPYGDEYFLSGLVKTLRTGHVSFETFWLPHNEHRILIPRIVFTILLRAIGWNSGAIMVVSWGIITGASFFLFYGFVKIFDTWKPRLWLATVALSFLLFFSPVQRENWLWAFQLSFFLVQAGAVLSLFLISFNSISPGIRLPIAMLFAGIASLSSAQGLMVWPALLVAFALGDDAKKRKIIGLLALIVAMISLYTVYLIHYKTPSYGHMQLTEILRQPLLPLSYFVGLLGSPLTFSIADNNLRTDRAVIAGSILLFLFVWFCYLNLRTRQRGKAAPWIGLGCFVLAFCTITTYGRIDIGILSGVSTGRYTTHTLLLTVAVLGLGYLAFKSQRQSQSLVKVFGFSTFLLSVGICILSGYADGFQRAGLEHQGRLLAKKLLPFFDYFDGKTDGCVTGPYFAFWPAANMGIFDSALKPYTELGYVHMEKNVKFIPSPTGLKGDYLIAGNANVPTAVVNVFGQIRSESDVSPNLVFVKQEGQDKFIAATELKAENGNDHDRIYRWQLPLSAQLLVNGDKKLEMWVYNRASNAFLKVE